MAYHISSIDDDIQSFIAYLIMTEGIHNNELRFYFCFAMSNISV